MQMRFTPVFCTLLLFLLLMNGITSPSYGVPPKEKYQKIQKEILEHKQKLKKTQKREYSVLGEIERLDKQLRKIESELRKLKKKLSRTESDIATVKTEIGKTKESLTQQADWIKRKLRALYKYGYSRDVAAVLLNIESVSQMMRISRYLEQIAIHEHEILEGYRQNLKIYTEKNNKLRSLKATLLADQKTTRKKELQLRNLRKSKKMILASLRDEKASHEKMIAELREASKKLLKLIEEASKAETYAATGFSGLKGKLPWPVNGKIAIPYGSHTDPRFNTPLFRNGVHIQTKSLSAIRSVHNGKVIFAEWFKGFGQLIIVDHGNGYHSLYGNLSEIFSRVGDIIKRDQVIGKVGTSGILNAPGLYFEIRYKGKPLDPSQWLQRKRT